MEISGFATPEGTARYRERFAGRAAEGHFRERKGLWLSSVGIGTYLGEHDEDTDKRYARAVARALELGANVVDPAINYRFQRSERAVGAALHALLQQGKLARDEVVVASKAGFLTFDADPPPDPRPSGVLRPEIHSTGRDQAGGRGGGDALHDPALSRRPARAQPPQPGPRDPRRPLPPQPRDPAGRAAPRRVLEPRARRLPPAGRVRGRRQDPLLRHRHLGWLPAVAAGARLPFSSRARRGGPGSRRPQPSLLLRAASLQPVHARSPVALEPADGGRAGAAARSRGAARGSRLRPRPAPPRGGGGGPPPPPA